ncbi:hypothetical protein PUR71_22250 [Streptomyces sp. SP17BM10]|uniref:hypothetical protein n=1 Tax=Streptomyces sp. SP17BM10 TaxID=3002530 RepID=UPI002E78989D|nr:hypothetical protein [Streptomyces sp. SP17BM10]MEE1785604.1 hypothetical protein [Streptomyces sp. SP17BM10]
MTRRTASGTPTWSSGAAPKCPPVALRTPVAPLDHLPLDPAEAPGHVALLLDGLRGGGGK